MICLGLGFILGRISIASLDDEGLARGGEMLPDRSGTNPLRLVNQNSSNTSPSLGDPSNDSHPLTEEEVELQLRLQDEMMAGNYVLLSEFPATRNGQERGIKRYVENTSARRAGELESVFLELGLDETQRTQLKNHLASINKASLQAELAIHQLLMARQDYEHRLDEALSDQDFERYRKYEESQHAVREYEHLEDYLKQQNIDIDHLRAQELINLIGQAEAYTSDYWHGPFDRLPQVVVGTEPVKEKLRQNIVQVTSGMERIESLISQSQLPEDYKAQILNYYRDDIRKKQEALPTIGQPPFRPRSVMERRNLPGTGN